ncbi:hypothetical protein D3C85_1385320 [compost metagenome]
MEAAICGIIHGVMPTNGAPVAYRRCKVGMRDEDYGTSLVIGGSGQEVTAVFAQSPGALQLLPTRRYSPGWLKLLREEQSRTVPAMSAVPSPSQCPYETIYLERSRWWGVDQRRMAGAQRRDCHRMERLQTSDWKRTRIPRSARHLLPP